MQERVQGKMSGWYFYHVNNKFKITSLKLRGFFYKIRREDPIYRHITGKSKYLCNTDLFIV